MSYTIYQTNAEEIIGATDAVIQKTDGANHELISEFLSTSMVNAQNAAGMAVELNLIRLDEASGDYFPKFPFASYLVTGNPNQKAAILRLVLEEYEPYKMFKYRLKITNSAPDSANQIKAIFGLTAHSAEINHTLISLGTFTNSINVEGAGRFSIVEGSEYEFIEIFESVIHNAQEAEVKIRARLGEEICDWIDTENVFNPIVTAFQRANNADVDARSPIVNAGNGVESFLTQVAGHYAVDLTGAHGINAKILKITTAGHLTVKHKNMCKYLGHVRNACDHGIDIDIGDSWTISEDTGLEYVHIALTTIRSIYDCIHGNHII